MEQRDYYVHPLWGVSKIISSSDEAQDLFWRGVGDPRSAGSSGAIWCPGKQTSLDRSQRPGTKLIWA